MTTELKPCPFCGGKAHFTKEIKSANLAAIVMCSDNDCCSNHSETLEQAVKLWNTRATPDVPELVRYEIRMFAGKDYAEALPSPIGEYVRHDQAAALIDTQAKMYRLALSDNIQLAEKLKVAEVELAQIKAQEPIMCLYDRDNGDGTYSKVTEVFPLPKHAKPMPNSVTTLLFAAPAVGEVQKPVGENCILSVQKHLSDAGYKIPLKHIDDAIAKHYAAPVASEAQPFAEVKDAVENLVIAVGMGWDLEGVLEKLNDAYNTIPSPVASEAETIERLEAEKVAMRKAATDYCWHRYKDRAPMNLRDPAVFTSHEWQKIGEAMDDAVLALSGKEPS